MKPEVLDEQSRIVLDSMISGNNDALWQVWALTKLYQYLPDPERTEAYEAMFEAFSKIGNSWNASEAMVWIAPLMAAREGIDTALEVVSHIQIGHWGSIALTRLVPLILEDGRRPQVMADALHAALDVDEDIPIAFKKKIG